MRVAFTLFGLQFLNYSLIVINTRAYTNDHIVFTIVSDFVLASINYFIIKKISDEVSSAVNWFSYTLGGTLGAVFGMFISKYIGI